jgi:hypothetical protein
MKIVNKNPTVPERLKKLGQLFADRNALYGDNYKNFGKVMIALFPEGIELKTESEFNRFCIFVQIVSKASRYSSMFKHGGHPDSLDDTAVYSQMLAEVEAQL